MFGRSLDGNIFMFTLFSHGRSEMKQFKLKGSLGQTRLFDGNYYYVVNIVNGPGCGSYAIGQVGIHTSTMPTNFNNAFAGLNDGILIDHSNDDTFDMRPGYVGNGNSFIFTASRIVVIQMKDENEPQVTNGIVLRQQQGGLFGGNNSAFGGQQQGGMFGNNNSGFGQQQVGPFGGFRTGSPEMFGNNSDFYNENFD